MSQSLRTLAALIVFVSPLAIACGPSKKVESPTTELADAGPADAEVDVAPPPPKTTFEKIGGKEAIAKQTEELLKKLGAHADTKFFFAPTLANKAKREKLAEGIVGMLCWGTEGGCPEEVGLKQTLVPLIKAKKPFDKFQQLLGDMTRTLGLSDEELTKISVWLIDLRK